jgi:hypothetical protein
MVVDGDKKTDDVKTVMRSSLETTLAARLDGCKRVRAVVEAESESLHRETQTLKTQIDEIVKRWIAKCAFAEAERQEITEKVVMQRWTSLCDLRTWLEEMQTLLRKKARLATVKQEMDEVKDLPDLICLRDGLGTVAEKLRVRADNLIASASLSDEILGEPPLVSDGDPLYHNLRAVDDGSSDLIEWLAELKEHGVEPQSSEDLSRTKGNFEDDKAKLESALTALAEQGDGCAVVCKVYRGKRLLVQLAEEFAKKTTAIELQQAVVIAPYSKAQAERVTRLVETLGKATAAANELGKSIQTARTAVDTRIGDIRVSIGQKQTALRKVLPSIRELECPPHSLPDCETGANVRTAEAWIGGTSQGLMGQIVQVRTTIDGLLNTLPMDGWRRRIESHLRTDQQVDSNGSIPPAPLLDEIIRDLREAARSIEDYRDNHAGHLNSVEENERICSLYQEGVQALDIYLNELQFKEETVQALAETFLLFVRNAQQLFGFQFRFELDDRGNPKLHREDLEGAILTGGGETQILGILMMLAVAVEFGFPVFVDEIGSYLHQGNLRKLLEFIYNETDIQVILTTADDELLDRLKEWGIEHKSYVVTKDSNGLTHVKD